MPSELIAENTKNEFRRQMSILYLHTHTKSINVRAARVNFLYQLFNLGISIGTFFR